MSGDWVSYDSAAATHARLGTPAMFARPARELAARMDFGRAGSALDVGTGSGAVAALAGCAMVVGVDPSAEMARQARSNGVALVAVAAAPGLPFRDATFDRVTAGFVLSHVAEYEAALADMTRATRPGGRVGVTAWSARSNPYRDCWDGVLAQFVDAQALRAALARFTPWEEFLGVAENLQGALERAGLRDVVVEEIDVPVHLSIEEFLRVRDVSGPARFLRTVVDYAEFERFRAATRAEFRRRFRDPIDHSRGALIAVGKKEV
jgi:ubiquinone/menaquinone biosynthesis C-methylase UbiE